MRAQTQAHVHVHAERSINRHKWTRAQACAHTCTHHLGSARAGRRKTHYVIAAQGIPCMLLSLCQPYNNDGFRRVTDTSR